MKPTVFLTVPTRVSAGQLPARASCSWHLGTAAREPTAPAGSESLMLRMFFWPSPREMVILETELAPAVLGSAWASSTLGAKGTSAGGQFWSISSEGVCSLVDQSPALGTEFQPVSVAWPSCVPQVSGFTSGARSPPLSRSFSSPKGSSGWFTNTFETVPSSATITSPPSLIRRPLPSISRKSFQGLSAVARPGPEVGPKNTLPPTGFGITGLRTVSEPIWEPAGHATGSSSTCLPVESTPNCS